MASYLELNLSTKGVKVLKIIDTCTCNAPTSMLSPGEGAWVEVMHLVYFFIPTLWHLAINFSTTANLKWEYTVNHPKQED